MPPDGNCTKIVGGRVFAQKSLHSPAANELLKCFHERIRKVGRTKDVIGGIFPNSYFTPFGVRRSH